MKRRLFFKTSVLSGSALALSGVSACSSESGQAKDDEDYSAFEFNEATVDQLGKKMETGELSSADICRKYLERIKHVDPLLKSVIELNPEVLEIAEKLDDERKKGKIRGALHGIPVLIKDNIDTGDRMKTTAGSLALSENQASIDSAVVKKLREAGAVLLGKTNMSEWANFRSDSSSSGWSARGGQVRNPYCPERSPCGSSSGTGAAVAANLCAIGIGTETNGSIVCPSGINGIVGIKPTLGLWSQDGIVPIAHSQDTAGPMARTVKDAAILLGALAENPPQNSGNLSVTQDYTRFLDPNGLSGKRIGIAVQMTGFNKKTNELFKQAIDTLTKNGAEVAEVKFDHYGNWEAPSYEVLLYEFKSDLNKYLQSHHGSKIKSLDELIEWNNANSNLELQWFGQEIFIEASKKGDLFSGEYVKSLADAKRFAGKEGIDALMEKHKLDAVIAPTNGPAWTIDLLNGDHFTGGSSSPAAIAGYPNITVPMGFINGLPIGISFFGKAWSEPTLLAIAYSFEQATHHRKAPGFLKSIN